jgi:hypothetical protein
MRWIVSEVNAKMMRKSGVNEQAYLSCRSPLSLCVSSEGVKGFSGRTVKISRYRSLNRGFFRRSFLAFLEKDLENLVFRCIQNCLHGFVNGFKNHSGFFFSFKYPLYKSLVFLFFFNKEAYVISYLLNPLRRKFEKHFIDIGYCNALHKINNNG